ncbi:MAG: HAD-IIIA family hydrolase [Chitinophagia bacterium]|nr:HAD-IIIA family hydrolase [Chitinophagia bacterium]
MLLSNGTPINASWTLFLDRDGVINVEQNGSYITAWQEFVFHHGFSDALSLLHPHFGNVLVVTNQRGVGRGIMTHEALINIHNNMLSSVQNSGGRIDKVYACIAVADDDHNRKPNTGMAYQAKQDFPHIDFNKSIMVGNSISDMEFGKKMGMYTVFLTTKSGPYAMPHPLIDAQHASFMEWVGSLGLALPAHLISQELA